jgi:hypothetical protein
MGGRDQSERLVAINRNQWSQSAGTRKQRANSPFGISLVRLRDDDAIATIIGLMRLTFGA